MLKRMNFTINGKHCEAELDPSMRFIDVLRDHFGLTGTKEGCAEGECGACTVLMNGEPVASCVLLAGQADGSSFVTIEGIVESGEHDRLIEAFMKVGAVQCGFCTPGILVSVKALLDRTPHPSELEIKQAISGNLCRCTGYKKIIEAVEMGSKDEAESSHDASLKEAFVTTVYSADKSSHDREGSVL